jgi:GAF domain-containing protein
MPRWWADEFARVALELAQQPTLEDTLQAIVDQAVATIDGAEFAAITIRNGSHRFDTVAASDELPRVVDAIQYQANEGPCLSALRDGVTYRSDDISTDPRWPAFGPAAAAETPILSMLSNPLMIEDGELLAWIRGRVGDRGVVIT